MNEEVMEQVENNIAQLIADRQYPASKVAKQILSIPEIRIEAKDQSLPDNVCEYDDGKDFTIGYKLAQQDMLKENWKKVLPKVK